MLHIKPCLKDYLRILQSYECQNSTKERETIYKNVTSPLFLRFTHERKNKFISLAVAVYPECWDYEQQQVTKEHPESQLLNSQIRDKLGDYKRKIQKLEILEIPVTFDNLFESKNKRKSCTISDCFGRKITRLESLGKYTSASKFKVTLSLLSQFKNGHIRLDEIDLAYLNFHLKTK